MKRTKKIIAVLLSLALVLTMCPAVFADSADHVKKYENICCIGDSVGTGYSGSIVLGESTETSTATNGYMFETLDTAFGKLTAKAVKGNYLGLTCVGLRCLDVLYMLGAEGYADYDYKEDKELLGEAVVDAIQDQKSVGTAADGKTAIEKVTESDLIIIQLGSNETFADPFFEVMMSGSFSASNFLKALIEGEKTLKQDYPQMLKKIRELNPNATIVLLSQFNPYEHLAIRVLNKDYEVGQVLTACMERFHTYYKNWAKQYDAIFVDTTGVTKFFETAPLNVKDFNLLSYDTHYSPDGHEYVADLIISALDSRTALNKPQAGSLTIKFDGQDIGDFTFIKKLGGWQIKNEDGMYLCFDNYNGLTLRYTSPTTWKYNGGLYVNGVSIEKKLNLPILKSGKQYLAINDTDALITTTSKTKVALYQN